MDLCSNMAPGEGMLVGSFARGLFLVHSECAESAYINSRPFRVNAGPVRRDCRLLYSLCICAADTVQPLGLAPVAKHIAHC